MGGAYGHGLQSKIIFRDPFDSIGRAKTNPSVPSERPNVLSINFYKIFKIIYSSGISDTLFTACMMHSVKHSGKLATATTLLL